MVYRTLELTSSKELRQQPRKQSHFYKGFSSLDGNQNTKLYDFDLIKQDIINHFRTRKGERVMNPEFGSIIWDLIMEPLTDDVRERLTEDIQRICTSDPRVTPTQLDLTEFPSGYLLELTLTLNGTDQSESLKLAFDQQIGLVVQ